MVVSLWTVVGLGPQYRCRLRLQDGPGHEERDRVVVRDRETPGREVQGCPRGEEEEEDAAGGEERPAIGPHRRPQSRSACGGAQRAGAGLTSRSSVANLPG